jgi:signal peptidase I
MGKFGTVKVAGNSMLPAYRDGDWLIVSWLEGPSALTSVGGSIIGKTVVVEREDRPGIFLVKRVLKFEGEAYWVEGDSIESTDSRTWGWITPTEIIGIVRFKMVKFSKRQTKTI